MKDINGQELHAGGLGQLLCEILSAEQDRVVVRIVNSELELAIGTRHDEVLGGYVADSELVAFAPMPTPISEEEQDGVRVWPME